ncbi:MAG: aspartate aminotransferase family protein [Candidatus Xenobia bacterium]
MLEQSTIPDLEKAVLAPVYSRPPMVFSRGEGVWLFDTDGRRYLDCLAGIAVNALGYADPDVEKSIREAAGGLLHLSNLFHTEPNVLLARDLVEASFADRVFFCNSGTEAVEGALKMARKWAQKPGIVAFEGSFHGRSMGALSVTWTEKYRKPFDPLLPGVCWAKLNDVDSVQAVLGPEIGAVIVEPVQGEGGVHPADAGFLQALRALCDQAGVALIFDEVQCGLGRTGTRWAHEAAGVTPDLMTLAKPLANGLPIGAILMTERIASALSVGDHGSTFGGGPFVTTVARTVVQKILAPSFLARVRETGAALGEMLHDLGLPVRGRGLMWGLQLPPDRKAEEVQQQLRDGGVIVGTCGGNTLRIVPPLIFEAEHVAILKEALVSAL